MPLVNNLSSQSSAGCAEHLPQQSSGSSSLTIGVQISTYKRPAKLQQCLDGLARQTILPDDIIVVCQDSDIESCEWLSERAGNGSQIRVVTLSSPGAVASRNAGLEACHTDILAIIDDDVVPHADWVCRIRDHFKADPSLGGLGGRDHVHDGERFDERLAKNVGYLNWWGRDIGNHHLGYGRPREVQILKGANMSYRAQAIAGLRFDTRLRGSTVQPHEDLAFSLAVNRRGWKLLYDPAVLVYHFAGRPDQRAYSSNAASVDLRDLSNAAFNSVIALWDKLTPARRAAFVFWSIFIGTGVEPGVLQAFRYMPRLGVHAWRRFWWAQRGKIEAFLLVSETYTKGRVRSKKAAPAREQ